MKKSRFTDEQIIGMIKEQESGIPTVEVCRKYGISSASFYKYNVSGLPPPPSTSLTNLRDTLFVFLKGVSHW